MRRHIRRTRQRFFKRATWRTRLMFWLGAIIVGLSAGMFALVGDYADHFFRDHVANTWWLPFIVTPLGLVAIYWATHNLFAGAEGGGVQQTLMSLNDTSGKFSKQFLSVRVAVGRVVLTIAGLFAGATVGRAAPSIHLGAAIMYSIGRYMHVPAKYLERGLILTGGGAGIAAAFNAPLAGIVFAIEEMARSFDRRNTPMMLIGIVLAGMTMIAVRQDNYNYYGTTPEEFNFNLLWIGVLVCGVVGGLLGGTFSQLVISGTRFLRPYMPDHGMKIVFTCGVVLAIIGLLSGGTSYGTGYIESKQIVVCAGSESCTAEVSVFYPIYKMLATMITSLSGIPGGIFSPSLASGAGLGYDIALYFPVEMASTIVVLGMVAYFSGVLQTPITAFIIVMEMTDNQDLVLALMATSLIATGTSKLICKKSIYVALAENFMSRWQKIYWQQ
jgi:H+/Cl- antiporter ClcA